MSSREVALGKRPGAGRFVEAAGWLALAVFPGAALATGSTSSPNIISPGPQTSPFSPGVPQTPVQPGQLQVSTTVRVVYAIQ